MASGTTTSGLARLSARRKALTAAIAALTRSGDITPLEPTSRPRLRSDCRFSTGLSLREGPVWQTINWNELLPRSSTAARLTCTDTTCCVVTSRAFAPGLMALLGAPDVVRWHSSCPFPPRLIGHDEDLAQYVMFDSVLSRSDVIEGVAVHGQFRERSSCQRLAGPVDGRGQLWFGDTVQQDKLQTRCWPT